MFVSSHYFGAAPFAAGAGVAPGAVPEPSDRRGTAAAAVVPAAAFIGGVRPVFAPSGGVCPVFGGAPSSGPPDVDAPARADLLSAGGVEPVFTPTAAADGADAVAVVVDAVPVAAVAVPPAAAADLASAATATATAGAAFAACAKNDSSVTPLPDTNGS